uniref:Solute carrier organic anion transporter family member n=1 Tax=Syphacia muris TaxID=451379 RepID=A0A158R5P2_9BILA
MVAADFKNKISRFKPKWLQKLNNAPFLLVALSLCAVCQGSIVNGFISTSISSIEKRFSLSSTESGVFSSFYDVAVVAVLAPISYFGNKCHKGKIVATGMLAVGAGSVALILPHFLAGTYYADERASDVCTANEGFGEWPQHKDALNRVWYMILLFSQLLIGIGAAPLFTLGISYLDENVAQNRIAIYLGIYMAVSTIGPALGFIIGGQLLKIWGDIGRTDYRSLGISGSTDPRWYGAWWIGFLVVGILSILSAFPLYGFPRELPEKSKNRSKDVKQTHKDLDREYGKTFCEYIKIIASLLTNYSVLALVMMQTLEAFLMNGFITFIPKVFENIFNFTASYASTITGKVVIVGINQIFCYEKNCVVGIIVVPVGLLGSLFGAVMARKVRNFRSMIGLAMLFNIIALLLCFIFFYRCDQLPFAGVGFDYNGKIALRTELNSSCNSDCHCSNFYNPVCNTQTGITYYSPCYAGCDDESITQLEWSNCRCVLSNQSNVVKGLCPNSCPQILFFAVFGLLCFFTFSSAIPIQNASLRYVLSKYYYLVVSFETRDISIGLTWLFMRILGSIPGAITFGYAIDKTCVLWRKEGLEAQSCLRYNARRLSLIMFLFAVTLKTLIVICLATSFYFYKRSYDEKENIEVESNLSKDSRSQQAAKS